MATSVKAGISMGFAEAMSDDGVLSGRGHPGARAVCGLMTTVGGIGHTLPLISTLLLMSVAAIVVVELAVIAWIRHRYGHATAFGGLSGHRGRRPCFHRRHLDRLCLSLDVTSFLNRNGSVSQRKRETAVLLNHKKLFRHGHP
jgi:hypothetical protein